MTEIQRAGFLRLVLWPTLAFLPALAVLLALGAWQVQRLEWKEGLIDRIEQRAVAAPVDIAVVQSLAAETGDIEYLNTIVTGVFDHSAEMHMFAPGPQGSGQYLVTPLRLASGESLLVNRGYVPDRLLADAERPLTEVTITGLARIPEVPGLFTPDNDPDANAWFWRDLEAMTAVVRRVAPAATNVAVLPFFLDASAVDDGSWPRGGVTRLDLPNRHLEYALTWFGMAGALSVVYVLFLRTRFRSAAAAPAARDRNATSE